MEIHLLRAEEALLENDIYVYFAPTINTMINFDSVPCTISTESSSYFDASIAWALQKNSPYKSLFNLFLTKIKENGQLQRLETKYISKTGQITCHEGDIKPIEFQVIFTAFVLLGIGVIIAISIAICEKTFKRLQI